MSTGVLEPARDFAWETVVAVVVVVLGPAVEFPVHETDFSVAVGAVIVLDDEGWAGVAHPAPIGGCLEESHGVLVNANGVKLVGHASFHRCARDDDMNRLDPAQVADDLGVNPADGREFSRPVVAVVGPGDPGCRVRLPLGGHAIAKSGGFLVGWIHD